MSKSLSKKQVEQYMDTASTAREVLIKRLARQENLSEEGAKQLIRRTGVPMFDVIGEACIRNTNTVEGMSTLLGAILLGMGVASVQRIDDPA